VKLDGWAVESRVYAEDPTRNFLPSIGRLTTYQPPAEGPVGDAIVRNDTGVEEGGEIAIHYDPMIAKLVTWAPTRLEAIEAQGTALDAFAIDGIRHNIPFLATLMAHPRWRSGELSTGFIKEEFPDGFVAPVPEGKVAHRLAAVAAAIDHKLNQRKRGISGQMRDPGLLNFERERVVQLADQSFNVTVSTVGNELVVTGEDGTITPVRSDWRPGQPVWSGTVGEEQVAIQVRGVLNGVFLQHAGAAANARVYTRREAELAALMPIKETGDSGKQLLCPMPGLVKQILVEEGQEVKTGEALAIVEAMKMENVLRAERDGKISTIAAKEGDSLAVDEVILEFA
jgi:propionyl-CoA carboxylase alpha chain